MACISIISTMVTFLFWPSPEQLSAYRTSTENLVIERVTPQERGHRMPTPRLLNARANQPAIKHSPPRGVTGPMKRKRSVSRVKAYKLPLNMVMPAVKRAPATGLLLATRRATEWTSCDVKSASSCVAALGKEICREYLVLGRSRPICKFSRI